tara:strand:+ start:6363 stop:6911 length:549 start_codon:yes stop_codon:yes gene_type:complete
MNDSLIIRALRITFCTTLLALSGQTVAAEVAEVAGGAEIINNNCARCHNSRPIQEFSIQEWSVIMPHMREKAHLTGLETEAVMDFLRTISGVPEENTASTVATTAVDGSELMTRFGCQGCHAFKGQGGALGPALDSVVEQKGTAFVQNKLKDPQFNNPASAMPKMPLSDVQINALIDFLTHK